VYESFNDSFSDYVNLLQSTPRYADALSNGGSISGFFQSLAKAGYATDPQYATKLLDVATGPTMQSNLSELLKNPNNRPI
jgi:flagellar protein FlgJ